MTNDELVNTIFDEVVKTRMVNGRPMVSDEQTLRDQDFAQACRDFVAAEFRFNECAKKREQPNFDVCLWFDLLEERYLCEKKVWTIFTAGDRSRYTGLMYLEFRAALFAGGKLRANV